MSLSHSGAPNTFSVVVLRELRWLPVAQIARIPDPFYHAAVMAIPQDRTLHRIPCVSRVVAIASGKGGVGKTTVAVNLALALRRGGARVGIYDADLYGPNVHLMLGVRGRKEARRFIPLARAETEPYIRPLRRFGLQVMSVGFWLDDAETVRDDARLGAQMIRQTLQDVIWGQLDYLIIDFPAGTGEPQATLLSTIHIDGVILVTTPQDMSLMDTTRSLGLFRQTGVAMLGLVENMSYFVCPHCGKVVEVFAREQRSWEIDAATTISRLGRVPLDSAISRRVNADHPLTQLVPDSIQATAVRWGRRHRTCR